MRNYVRKTNRLPVPEDLVRKALEDIINGKKSFRQAAAFYNLKASTLSWRFRNLKFYQNDTGQNLTSTGLRLAGMNTKQSSRQVFTMDQEKLLAQHLMKCSQLCYDLNMSQIREFAYSFAVSLNRKVPESWMINQSAGQDWARSFMKRHRYLPFGKNNNTSNLESSQSLPDDYNMDAFYENLGLIQSKLPSMLDMYNLLLKMNEKLDKIVKQNSDLLLFRNEGLQHVKNSLPLKNECELKKFNESLNAEHISAAFSEWAKTAKVTDVLADELIPSFNFSGKCGKISLIGQPFYIIWKNVTTLNDFEVQVKNELARVKNKMNQRKVKMKKKGHNEGQETISATKTTSPTSALKTSHELGGESEKQDTNTRKETETGKDEVFLDYSIVKEEYAVQEDAPDSSTNQKTLEETHREALQFVINELEKRKHKCAECGQEFCYMSDLKRHSVVHTSDKLHCPHCPRAFVHQMSLKRHLVSHSAPEEPQPCGICGKMLSTSQSLRAHVERHSSNKKYECEKCGKKFTDKQDLKRHIQRIHHGRNSSKLSGKTFTCHCGKTFYNKTLYDRHKVTHSEIKTIACPICSNKFKSVLHLRSHLLVHSDEKPFQCRVCKMTFKKKSILRQHATTHTGSTPNCPYCRIPLRSAGGVKKHIEIFHRGLPKDIPDNFSADNPISCTICSKVCKNLETLKEHVKIHPAKKSSSCEICEKNFIDDEALKRHQKHKHENTSTPSFSCGICGKNFLKKYGLIRHMETHKRERPLYSCKICGIQHVSKYNLRKHELMHNINEEILGNEDHQAAKIKIEDTEMPADTQVEFVSITIKSEPE